MSAPVDLEEMRWHALPSNEIARILDVELAGLSAQDVNRQAARFGPNALPTPSRRNPLPRSLAQFNNTLMYVLLAGALAAGLPDPMHDAAVIVAGVLMYALHRYLRSAERQSWKTCVRTVRVRVS